MNARELIFFIGGALDKVAADPPLFGTQAWVDEDRAKIAGRDVGLVHIRVSDGSIFRLSVDLVSLSAPKGPKPQPAPAAPATTPEGAVDGLDV